MYRQRRATLAVVALSAWSLAMLVVPALFALPLAVGHAQFHALVAIAALLPALVLARRGGDQPTMASTAPIVGLSALGIAQLVESLGGLGYGPDNDARANGLAALHDLGLAIMPLGLIAALIGVTVGIGLVVARRSGRPALATAIVIPTIVAGGFGLLKLLGF